MKKVFKTLKKLIIRKETGTCRSRWELAWHSQLSPGVHLLNINDFTEYGHQARLH